MAELLCKTVQQVDGFRYQKHLQKWEVQFELLHEEDGVPTSLIWKVLQWYCSMREARTDSQLPKCVTANMFRGAFGWIRERWTSGGGSLTETEPQWVEAAERTFKHFEFNHLPIKVERLAGLYQAIADWHRGVVAHLKSLTDQVRMNFLYQVVNPVPDGTTIPEQVGQYLHSRVTDWSGWNGNLDAFKPGGHEFVTFLQRRSLEIWQTRLTERDLKFFMRGVDAATTD
jgi:hypothetical protein